MAGGARTPEELETLLEDAFVLGDSLALYNPAVRVAEEFAMLDCISGGRLVAA